MENELQQKIDMLKELQLDLDDNIEINSHEHIKLLKMRIEQLKEEIQNAG